jgi:chloramphenicol-sensitive protein RarD
MVIGLTLIGGLLLTVNWLTFIHIVNNINVKTASFSYLICPVMTAALGYLLIGEKLSRLQWIAVGLCTLSCVLIGINSALELGFSFLTALTYALYLISQRKNQGFDRMVILGVQILFALSILTAGAGLLLDRIPTEGRFFSIILFIAVAFTVLPLFLNLFALNKINSATIGILMYINPMINFILAFLLFNESITLIQTAGYLIILVALIVFNFSYLRTLPLQFSNGRRGS